MRNPSAFHTVPVIDISGLRGGGPDAFAAVADQVGAAARDIGFFYISGTGLPADLFDEMLAQVKVFFDRPLEDKMKTYIGLSTCHRGYVPKGEEGMYGQTVEDLKEAFDTALELPADDPDHVSGNPMLGPNAWPDQPGFAEAVTAYYEAMLEVGGLLFQAFALALGEPIDTFTSLARKAPSQLRLIHYPFDPSAVDALGIGAHTDYECFTLLRGTAPGLEVLNGAKEWIDVPPLPGTYVVNVGDLIERMTGGTFVATTHRVRKVAEERYSFPLFFNLDYHTVVEPLPAFASPEEDPLPPLVAGEHLFAETAKTFRYLRERSPAVASG